MKPKRAATPKWTAVDRARHKAIRQAFKHCPTQEELEASGAYDGPIKSGAYFQVRVLIHELKKVREAAGLTLAAVSKRTGMDQATLSRLENGRQPNEPGITEEITKGRQSMLRKLLGGAAAWMVLGNLSFAAEPKPTGYTTYTNFVRVMEAHDARYPAMTRVSDPGAREHPVYTGFFF